MNLRKPPPLERELRLERDDEARLVDPADGSVVADGRRLDGFDLEIPDAPPFEVALEADRHYPYHDDHAFPGCFVCGPDRDEGDGLCLYPGPVGDGSILTCVWSPDAVFAAPDGSIRDEVVWAALDCPSGNAAHHHAPGEGAMVLARLRGRLERPIAVGKPHVVAGWAIEQDGRKHRSGTAIYDQAGEPAAWAEALWIELRTEGGQWNVPGRSTKSAAPSR